MTIKIPYIILQTILFAIGFLAIWRWNHWMNEYEKLYNDYDELYDEYIKNNN